MKYKDLENDGQPVEERVMHLEREAGYVRDAVSSIRALIWGVVICSTVSFILLSVAVICIIFQQP